MHCQTISARVDRSQVRSGYANAGPSAISALNERDDYETALALTEHYSCGALLHRGLHHSTSLQVVDAIAAYQRRLDLYPDHLRLPPNPLFTDGLDQNELGAEPNNILRERAIEFPAAVTSRLYVARTKPKAMRVIEYSRGDIPTSIGSGTVLHTSGEQPAR